MSEPFPEILRRHFIAVATSEYQDSALPPLSGVPKEVETLTAWLCNPALGARRFTPAYPELRANPTLGQVERALRYPEREWNDGDAAVVYVTGHGVPDRGAHWILLRDTNSNRLSRSALKSSDLIEWLCDTEAEHLLVVLDLCHAGATAELTVRLPELPETWLVLAATGAEHQAQTGALTRAITSFFNELVSPTGEQYNHGHPYLRVDDFLRAIRNHLPEPQRLHLVHTGVPRLDLHACLPNPHYVPIEDVVEPARRDLGIRPDDLDAHWAPKSRGSDTGWLFTGRTVLVRHLVGCLVDDQSDDQDLAEAALARRPLVVTGAAGTGKSAVLGRLVTLCDSTFRRAHPEILEAVPADLLPPEGAVDAALLATGKLSDEVFTHLLDALGIVSSDSPSLSTLEQMRQRWSTWLNTRSSPVTVVIDAVDEAKNPNALLDDVLAHLAPTAGRNPLRLIVGVRSTGIDERQPSKGPTTAPAPGTPPPAEQTDSAPLARSLAEQVVARLGAERIPVDEAPWWDNEDLANYAAAILTTTKNSPYAAAEGTPNGLTGHAGRGNDPAALVAAEIARRARKSFLVTRLAASNLAGRAEPVDPNDPVWHDTLDDGVLGVFRKDLHDVLPDPTKRLRAIHLLRAIAFAYGRGLPWSQIWPLVANAVADRPGTYGDIDIVELLATRLAGYLTTDQEDGITVYRLFHDALRGTLRDRWHELHQAT